MSYSEFKLSEVIHKFGLTIDENSGFFSHFPEEECSDLLAIILKENIDLACQSTTYLGVVDFILFGFSNCFAMRIQPLFKDVVPLCAEEGNQSHLVLHP